MPREAGNGDVYLCVDRRDSVFDLVEEALRGALHRRDNAELARAHLGGLARALDKFFDVERDRAHGRFEQAGLGAEVTVLGAAAGFERDDAFQADLDTAVLDAHLVGELEELGEVLVVNA